MDRDELGAWLRLTATPGVSRGLARKLLARFGLPQAIFSCSESSLGACVSPAQARALIAPPEGLEERLALTGQWLQGGDDALVARDVITLGDPRYPAGLLETEDPPLLLYVMGPAAMVRAQPFPAHHCIAVVGSRNPTAQGEENARQFAHALRTAGWTVVSGLALGVDAAAHEGALDAGASTDDGAPDTIAVVGTGLDRVYPRRNLELARRIAQHGLMVSEYALGSPPLAGHFPQRNRIIAGLSRGTLVVEAALASGSLITARLAAEQGREVFAIPGSIHAPQSRGCHALIRQGASLVESAQDILDEFAGGDSRQPPAGASMDRDATSAPEEASDPAESPLLRALGFDPQGLDALSARTGLDAARLQVELLELELEGRVARLPGGWFQRVHRG